MDPRRLRPGEWLVGGFGLLLLVSLFLPWYGVGDGGWTMYAPLASGGNATGWESLGVLDIVLAAVALAALAVPLVTAAYRVPAVPLAYESLATLVAFVAVVLVLFRVLDLPDGAGGRELGLWLALAASLGVFASGLVAVRDQRMPGVPKPDIETRPAPRPEAGA